MSQRKSVLCFGDSLTWGWIPAVEGAPTLRYPFEQRWTGAMARELGDAFDIIEEGLSARTTSADDPNDDRLNGSRYLPAALASHLPLDLVVMMLGTNDTKPFYNRTPYDIAYGMAKLVGQVLSCAGGVGTPYPAPKCLVVAPPPLNAMPHPYFQGMFGGAHEKSNALGKQYKDMANFMKVDFLDAGDVITTDGCDGIHFTARNNLELGKAIAAKVKIVMERDKEIAA
ncbi:SGNH/GDSL hydrolase family protein [Fulvimarina sp. 2208YS6-2-32]|uniref:SGNH/GDSL hydrolase family protein n=1 Tax=Fulvimarina uroteuthidis TaxID=3098149 RepID=A0ABU5I211_9HYPH|nr:SGNH/GDSL hydrolase family protein [Fulvimarina sp. 2208YS6-2-32]MDY8109399.1 SGNH/GDSL hydrolase family protein [Fulvimarina sp. 2208YS6-2-32]